MNLSEAARMIAPLLSEAARLHNSTEDAHMRRYLVDAINSMCRQIERFCVPRVSRAAAAKMPDHDLSTWTWKTQPILDPGRKIFHFEHMMTVRQMRILILADPAPSNCRRVLEQAQLVWILKEEDRELTKQKLASVRPDPAAAYAACGIELV